MGNKYNVAIQEWGASIWDDAWNSPAGTTAARWLTCLDISSRNSESAAQPFSTMTSQACRGLHFRDPAYLHWAGILGFGPYWHRKFWEWAVILETADICGLLAPGKRAIGFGVGLEPISAVLASRGVEVVATDMPVGEEQAGVWAAGSQHADSIESMQFPEICDPQTFRDNVKFMPLDMNHLPPTLGNGTFDFAWSSCVVEHLGSPTLGMDFVVDCARLLAPGGVMVHTTEYELLSKESTKDYGHCAIFRPEDLTAVAQTLRAKGLEVTLDLNVSLATPEDRWISTALAGYNDGFVEPAHLRLVIGRSVSTSYSIVVRRTGV
ncbi:MAG: methyltransferase domain-containing protein [Actinomycetes bacterium]